MLFLFSLAIALFTAFLLDKPLKKYSAAFYLSAALLTVTSVVIKQADVVISNSFVRDYLLAMFTRGALGAAFWAVVMWAGALPNGSAPIKKLMPIRGELSITAAILTLSHVVTYGIQYISDIIRDWFWRRSQGFHYNKYSLSHNGSDNAAADSYVIQGSQKKDER